MSRPGEPVVDELLHDNQRLRDPLVEHALPPSDDRRSLAVRTTQRAHKPALDDVDHELFNLLGARAAGALEAARLAAGGGGLAERV